MKVKSLFKKRKDGQQGAVIIEATISLSIFMFFMFTMLSLIQIAYVQSRVGVALDSVTKRLAEYSHVYYATELDEALPNSGGKSSSIANDLAEFLKELGGTDIGLDELSEMLTGAGEALDGDSLTRLIKHEVGGALVQEMLESDLGEDFCTKNHIKDGFDTSQCKFLENDEDIFFQVQYDIEVIKLLNIDYTFHMSSCSYAQAWAGE